MFYDVISGDGSPLNGVGRGINLDSWGRQKAVIDTSLFHGVFTYNVPSTMWVKYVDGVETPTSTDFSSEFGKLVITSGTTARYMRSRRHPRYQPNRGHLYSSSMMLPNKVALGTRNFGIFNSENGVFFRLRNGILYAVVRTSLLTVVESEFVIPVPTDIDLEKGNVYDIQMQWRGVGDMFFYINQKLVLTLGLLGTLDELSISNPALPIAFECINGGNAVEMYCGCVDLTSEGGGKVTKQYRAVTSGESTVGTGETPILLLGIPKTYDGSINTRDIVLQLLESYADQNAILRVYFTRDSTAFTTSAMLPVHDGFQLVSINGQVTSVDYSKFQKQHEKRVPVNANADIRNTNPEDTEFVVTSGDYILVTLQAKNNTSGGVTLIYGEEV